MAILQQLQRRKVIRSAAVYLIMSWLLLQIAATIAPILDLPDWFEKLVLALLVIGFPVALVMAWSLELTPEGLSADSASASSAAGRSFDYVVLTALLLGLGWFAFDRITGAETLPPEIVDQSVAVLAFTNLSNEENDSFTSGIHADLLTQLARIKSVRTISRTTVLKYKNSGKSIPEIAAELGVATVIEAGVQRAGNSVRINVQLIDAANDRPMWTQAFDRELTAANVFSIQSEIAQAIAGQLQATLSPEDERRLSAIPTKSIHALEKYFIGKEFLEERTEESLHVAVEYFEDVVELDPNFALAWSGLADAYMLLPEYSYNVDRNMTKRKSREALLMALALDPTLPEVRSTEAWFQLTRNYDWAGAEKIFTAALEAYPDNLNLLHWLSHTLCWQGRIDEGLLIARRAVEVAPDSYLMRMNLAYILTDARQHEEALQIARSVRDEVPDYLGQRRNLFLHELRAGRARSGAESYVAYTTIIGGDPAAAQAIGAMMVDYAESGVVGIIGAELVEATHLGMEDLAQVLAFVGDADGTLAALGAAIEERSGSRSALSMKINPAYDFIRSDPRFDALLAGVGL